MITGTVVYIPMGNFNPMDTCCNYRRYRRVPSSIGQCVCRLYGDYTITLEKILKSYDALMSILEWEEDDGGYEYPIGTCPKAKFTCKSFREAIINGWLPNKNTIKDELIQAALHPKRVQYSMSQCEDMEDYFNNI